MEASRSCGGRAPGAVSPQSARWSAPLNDPLRFFPPCASAQAMELPDGGKKGSGPLPAAPYLL